MNRSNGPVLTRVGGAQKGEVGDRIDGPPSEKLRRAPIVCLACPSSIFRALTTCTSHKPPGEPLLVGNGYYLLNTLKLPLDIS
jgi:hypothetical protein